MTISSGGSGLFDDDADKGDDDGSEEVFASKQTQKALILSSRDMERTDELDGEKRIDILVVVDTVNVNVVTVVNSIDKQ